MTEGNGGIKDFKTSLSGKTVLVTGANRGIGKAIALEFGRHGARLAISGRDQHRLNQAADEIRSLGVEVHSQLVDVRDERAICQYIHDLKKDFGMVNILVNNAGIYKTAPVLGHSSQDWYEVLETNLTSAFLFCREVGADLKRAGWGRIINISSISGRSGELFGAAYSASKFGMIGLTESLALELASYGVTVNAVCPGWVNTEMAIKQLSDPQYRELVTVEFEGDLMTRSERHPDVEESIEIARMSVPQQRFIEPEEVARLVVYLAGDAAAGITGQSINICGGMSV